MTSELQRQVQVLHTQNAGAYVNPVYRGRASLFLTASEAAAVDMGTVLEAAQNGLMTLNQYEGRFGFYTENLLHPSSVSVQRELKTKEENASLDKDINGLLALLSLYAPQAAAHKVLEYLIQRYRVHELNCNSLLRCLLSIHDTKIFARAVQLCTIEGSMWAFLDGVKRTGTPLPRVVLVKRMDQNVNLLAELCKVVKSAIKLSTSVGVRAQSTTAEGSERIISFFTACVVEMAQESPMEDVQLRQIYPLLVDGFRWSAKEESQGPNQASLTIPLQFLRSCCMIIAQTSKKTTFGQPLLRNLTSLASRAFVHTASLNCASSPPFHASQARQTASVEVIMTLAVIAQRQNINFDRSSLHSLFFDADDAGEGDKWSCYFLDTLRAIHHKFEVSDLITALVSGIVQVLTQVNMDDSQGENEENELTPSLASLLLCRMISVGILRENSLRLIIKDIIAAGNVNFDADTSERQFLVLRKIAQRYPNLFDGTIDALLQSARNQGQNKSHKEAALRNYLSKAFINAPHHFLTGSSDGGLSLLLSLRNPATSIRLEALRNFATSVPLDAPATRDIVGLAEAALICLIDQDVSIAEAAWSSSSICRIAKYVDNSLLSEACRISIDTWVEMSMREPKSGCTMLRNIFMALSEPLVIGALTFSLDSCDWISSTLIYHSLGLVTAIAFDASDESKRLCEQVGQAALTCVIKVRTVLPLLCHVSAGINDGSNTSSKILADAITHYVKDGKKDHLVRFSARTHDALKMGSSVVEKRSALLSMRLLCDAIQNVPDRDPTVAETLSKLVTPLLIHTISISLGSSAESLASLKRTVEMFTLVLENVNKIQQVQQLNMKGELSLGDTVKYFFDESSCNFDYRAEVLRALLAFPHPEVAPLVGKCLGSMTSHQRLHALVQVAANFTVDHDATNAFTFDPVKARAGALYAISSMMTESFFSPEDPSNSDYANKLLVILMLSASSCCDPDENIRRGGIALARKFVSLPASLKATRSELALFGDIVSKSSSVIAMDSMSAIAVFGTEIFGKNSDDRLSLQHAILSVACAAAWHLPGAIAPLLESSVAAHCDTFIKHFELVFSTSSVQIVSTGGLDATLSLSKALLRCFNQTKTMKQATQVIVSKIFCKFITADAIGSAQMILRNEIIDILSRGWASTLGSPSAKKSIYEALVQEQLHLPGQPNVLSALEHTPVEAATLVSIVKQYVEEFKTVFRNVPQGVDGNDTQMNVDEPSTDTNTVSGLSVQLHNVCSLLEGISPSIKDLATRGEPFAVGNVVSSLMELFSLTNDRRLRVVLSIEYCKSLIMGLVCQCISVTGSAIFDGTVAKTGKSSKTVDASSSYSKGRIADDVKSVLGCFCQTRAPTLQTSSLNLVRALVELDPTVVGTAIDTLGTVLSASPEGLWHGNDEILRSILSTLVNVISTGKSSFSTNSSNASASQDFLQPLCLHLRILPAQKRASLIKLVMSVMGDTVLPLCVGLLLIHVISAYDIVQSEPKYNSGNEDSFILLSRAAQRKAFRLMKTSQPEEIFDLAVDVTVSRAAPSQVCNLLALVRTSHQFLEMTAGVALSHENQLVSVEFPNGICTIDTAKLKLFHEKVSPNKDQKTLESRGSAAALAVLFLEFVHEVMENKNFHRSLALTIDAPNSNFKTQESFVELSDHLLQLLALSMQMQQQNATELVMMRFGASTVEMSIKAVGSNVSNWCLDILKSLQRLLDTPAFISILQELIDHESQSVRQVALQILGQRLEKLNPKRSSEEEKVLLLDLLSHLRGVVQTASATHASLVTRASAIGLAHSAIMCIDILAGHFAKTREWAGPLFESLTEMVAFSSGIYELVKKSDASNIQTYADDLKLLAASFLNCGTLTKVVGPKALKILPVLMSNLLGTLESQGRQLAIDDSLEFDDEEEENTNPWVMLWRSRLLLVRSAITAIGGVVAELHSFCHPYLQRIILSALALNGDSNVPMSERAALISDVDNCLTLLASRIPPRLSSPALLQVAPQVLTEGHIIARRFAQLLSETYLGLDRLAVVAHISDLSEMAALVLDYRRLHGDDSTESNAAEAMAIETVVSLCLKLTETELKQLLGRLGEWRDSKESSKQARRDSSKTRAASFYQLLAALGIKLKSIVVPCVGPFWTSALAALGNLSSLVSQDISDPSRGTSKKKRKLSGGQQVGEVVDNQGSKELTKIAMSALDFIRVTCLNDESEFVDESRYLATIRAVGPLISVCSAFDSEDDYLDFAQRCVSPCLVALAYCAKRDTLWKPLMHNLLMATRHTSSVVRLSALRAMHNLFIKIGEEFLLLLPECLPFFSELLEDDNSEVCDFTGVLIRYIEELSGESLDQLLV